MTKKILFSLFLVTISLLCAAEQKLQKPQKYAAPKLENPDSWSMVVVPDTQIYIAKSQNHGILDMMFTWITSNKKSMKIQQVLCVGDLVNQNDTGTLTRPNDYELVCDEQWEAVSRLAERLDGQVPYAFCTGNHDYGPRNSEDFRTKYGKYFKSNRNPLSREQLVECCPNYFGENTLENVAYEFTAPAPDNRKFLILVLQFCPTDAMINWAKKLTDSPRFADHFVILLTHSFIRGDGTRLEKEGYTISRKGGNSPEQIYQKLVATSKNIRMVICGHVAKADNWEMSVGFSETVNGAGKKVAQMVFNTQAIGGGFTGNGGDGWLRLLEFMPDRKTIKARTFSPFFAASPSTCHLAWKNDVRNEFTFTIE
jgi:hypothetical protein